MDLQLDLQTATNKCNGRLWPRPVLGKRRRNRIWVVLVRCLIEGKGKNNSKQNSNDRKQRPQTVKSKQSTISRSSKNMLRNA